MPAVKCGVRMLRAMLYAPSFILILLEFIFKESMNFVTSESPLTLPKRDYRERSN